MTLPAPTFTGPQTAPPTALLQLALTPLTPGGSMSVTVAPSTALGPALLIASCHVIAAPGSTLAGPVLTSDQSATPGPGTEANVPLLFPATGSISLTTATDAAFTSGVAPV